MSRGPIVVDDRLDIWNKTVLMMHVVRRTSSFNQRVRKYDRESQ